MVYYCFTHIILKPPTREVAWNAPKMSSLLADEHTEAVGKAAGTSWCQATPGRRNLSDWNGDMRRLTWDYKIRWCESLGMLQTSAHNFLFVVSTAQFCHILPIFLQSWGTKSHRGERLTANAGALSGVTWGNVQDTLSERLVAKFSIDKRPPLWSCEHFNFTISKKTTLLEYPLEYIGIFQHISTF